MSQEIQACSETENIYTQKGALTVKNKIIPISKHPLFNPEIGNDIIYLDDGEVSKVEKMIKEKYVETHHAREISFLENKNYWRTYVDNPRKEVTRRNRNDLIDYLYTYYKKQESASLTIAEVFEHLQEYRRNNQNRSENTLERDRQAFERFFEPEFRNRECIRITDDDISSYINKRSKALYIKDLGIHLL